MNWYDEEIFGEDNGSSFGDRGSSTKGNKGTSFWGKNLFDWSGKGDNIIDKVKLLTSVKNFVKILTGKDIPVKYSTDSDQSFTDGKTISISGNVSDEYDPTIGLALHEASHIVLSDFPMVRDLIENPSVILDKKYVKHTGLMKSLWNWVEDRRIDSWQYENSPGYKIYYQEMYKKYFESEGINKVLDSGVLHGKENVENYMTHIINFTNPKVTLDELKGLKEIYEELDIKDIDRLKSSKDSLDLSCKIFDIIEKYVTPEEMRKAEGDAQGDPSEGDDGDAEEYDGPISGLKPGSGKGGKPVKLGPNAKKELEELLKKQKNFLKGETGKEKVDEETNSKVNALIESETEEVGVSEKHSDDEGEPDFKVITVNKVTKSTINSGIYSVLNTYGENQTEDVKRGLVLGTQLGKRLQTRQEERTLHTPRLTTGKIDKRRLSSCGYGDEHIFFTNSVDKYGDISVHMSLDLSGSMHGAKWTNTMISAISIAKAASMTKGIRVQISLRYSDCISGHKEQAIVINFYDSLHDKPNKLKWFKYVSPAGCTPEGLCFEALMKKIMSPLLNKNSLFINYSDGYPGMDGLGHDQGIRMTKKAVDKIRKSGVEVLSFFISRGGNDDIEEFKQMYGKNSSSIDVTQLSPLARELNKKFLVMGKM
ncbi:hypothetical protein COB55_03635 [Candidatus Wolfebacteria bacterium]|nr:MAG: hypothetical protein COB55_03635 [Candidatus Wolfebacteria bacterium]